MRALVMASAMPELYGYLPCSHRASTSFGQYQIILLGAMANVCEQLAQSCYMKMERPGVEPTSWSQVQRSNHYTTMPHKRVWTNTEITLNLATVCRSLNGAFLVVVGHRSAGDRRRAISTSILEVERRVPDGGGDGGRSSGSCGGGRSERGREDTAGRRAAVLLETGPAEPGRRRESAETSVDSGRSALTLLRLLRRVVLTWMKYLRLTVAPCWLNDTYNKQHTTFNIQISLMLKETTITCDDAY